MSRLFWKIFLAFWASLILFSVGTVFTANQVIEHFRGDDTLRSIRPRVEQHAAELRQVAATQGIDAVKERLRRLDRREAVPFLLLDSNGEDLLQRPVHPRLSRRAERTLSSSRLPRDSRRHEHPPLIPIEIKGEGRYLLFPDIKSLSLSRVLGRPRIMLVPLLIATLVSALVGFLLARYLTAPLQRLRRATHRFAGGDLSHRVLPEIGSRRDEIGDLAKDFDAMAERLQVLLSSQRQLLSDVSHELRSPLARLQVALGLARQKSAGNLERELARIERESDSLNGLIGQLLSLTRLESGRQEVTLSRLNLTELLHSVVDDADYEARQSERRVRLVAAEKVMVEASDALIRSALENVIRNAVKYTDPQTTVSVELMVADDRRCHITVCDQGPGVPEDQLERLFEPFVRVGEARDRDSGGFGLGLSIAERAVRVHGGSMQAENRPEGGLLIRMELPLKAAKVS